MTDTTIDSRSLGWCIVYTHCRKLCQNSSHHDHEHDRANEMFLRSWSARFILYLTFSQTLMRVLFHLLHKMRNSHFELRLLSKFSIIILESCIVENYLAYARRTLNPWCLQDALFPFGISQEYDTGIEKQTAVYGILVMVKISLNYQAHNSSSFKRKPLLKSSIFCVLPTLILLGGMYDSSCFASEGVNPYTFIEGSSFSAYVVSLWPTKKSSCKLVYIVDHPAPPTPTWFQAGHMDSLYNKGLAVQCHCRFFWIRLH